MALGVGYLISLVPSSNGFSIYDNLNSGMTWISQANIHYFSFAYNS